MKLSRKFLDDYLDLSNIKTKEIAEKMVFLGNEYESVGPLCDTTELITGKILSVEKHPESKKLSICSVKTKDEELQILCGAPNVRAGLKVIVAPIGSVLPGDFKIKSTKIAGYESNGMICSIAELGLDKKFLKDSDIEGICELPEDTILTENPLEKLKLKDEVIDFELTSNRGDLLSVLGMAYEVGAIYNLDVKIPEVTYIEVSESINDYHTLKVETEKCFVYLAKLVKNITIKESPLFIKNRLIASGIRPINNVVDISNYVMLETGQPLHFFDADKIKNIIVREANNEEIITLDGEKRKLENDILITDNNKPVALAGVMGGLESEVTDETKNILIEAAIFDPISIRLTSKKTLRSEASNRFEKGIAKERTYMALKRAAELLSLYANGEVLKDELIYDNLEEEDKNIELKTEYANKILGMNLSNDDIKDVFNRLKFDYKEVNSSFTVTPPNRRLDISIKEDLIEEIGRIVGYNNLKGKLPNTEIKKGGYDNKTSYIRDIRNYVTSLGLTQTINLSLIKNSESELFVNDEKELVEILEPLNKEKSVMRNSLIPSLLNVYDYNRKRNVADINIFEIGSRYHVEDKVYYEKQTLSILMSGNYIESSWQHNKQVADFYLIKGITENLLTYLGFTNRYKFSASKLKNMHPYRTASITIDRQVVGFIGQVNNDLAKDVYVLELDLEKLYEIKLKPIKYKEQSKYPTISKDVAFLAHKDITADKFYEIIKKSGGRMLDSVSIFDVYNMEEEKSIAFNLVFKDEFKTLSDEEVMVVFNRIIKDVTEKLNVKLRSN